MNLDRQTQRTTKPCWDKELINDILQRLQEIFKIEDSPHKVRPVTKQTMRKHCIGSMRKDAYNLCRVLKTQTSQA